MEEILKLLTKVETTDELKKIKSAVEALMDVRQESAYPNFKDLFKLEISLTEKEEPKVTGLYTHETSPVHHRSGCMFQDGRKIPVIKALREVTGLGLKEAKEMSESTSPVLIPVDTKFYSLTQAKDRIKDAGGYCEFIGYTE